MGSSCCKLEQKGRKKITKKENEEIEEEENEEEENEENKKKQKTKKKKKPIKTKKTKKEEEKYRKKPEQKEGKNRNDINESNESNDSNENNINEVVQLENSPPPVTSQPILSNDQKLPYKKPDNNNFYPDLEEDDKNIKNEMATHNISIPSLEVGNDKTISQRNNETTFQRNNENHSIEYEEFLTEKQNDSYDMVFNFSSFQQLKKDGWIAYFTQEGYKKYLESNTKNVNVIGMVGIKNRGKSYLLGRIIERDNYNPLSGFLVTTYGISCNFPLIKKNNNSSPLPLITLDAAGKDNPLLQNAFYQNNENINLIARDQKVTEIVLSDFIIQKSNILIACIEQLTFAEQEMLKTLIGRLKQKEIEEFETRKLIVIHNLMNITTIKGIKDFINDILLNSLTFELEEQHMSEEYNDSDKVFYIQNFENDCEKDNQEKSKLEIYHLIIGNDFNDEIKKNYNEPAFRVIRDLITVDSQRKSNIIEEFRNFIIENSKKKYLSGENFKGFTNESLIIGEAQEKKFYTDKKKNETKEKILIPIILKDKNIEFEPSRFNTDQDGVCTFLNDIEVRYSVILIKEENNKGQLEIVFEMFGIVSNIKTNVQYDEDNNQIIITIKGENKEIDECEKEFIGPKEKSLQYKAFDFQVIINKNIPQKNSENQIEEKKGYIVEIENEEAKIDPDIDLGIYTLSFPITLDPYDKS